MLDRPPASSNPLRQLFSMNKPIIGMVHVKPLPGSPRARSVDLEADLPAEAVAGEDGFGAHGADATRKPAGSRFRRPIMQVM